MPRALTVLAAVAVSAFAGCGAGDVPVSGVIHYAGRPLQMPPGEDGVTATFLGLDDAGNRTDFSYMSIVQPDGRFTVLGPNRRGIPAGKYKVAVSSSVAPVGVKVKAVDFWSAFGSESTPVVVEVRPGVDGLTIDLTAPAK